MSAGALYDAVCIGAHPDDVEIGMGGAVAKMCAAGARVAIVDLTDGEPTPFGTPERRAQESARAAAILGVSERRTLSLVNRALFDTVEARTQLAETLRELRPRFLFVPYPEDAHPDHVAAHAICRAARFWSKLVKSPLAGESFYPPRVISYSAVHLRLAPQPTFIGDCSAYLEQKMEALTAYKSQFTDNPNNAALLGRIRDAASHWGSLGGVEAGEPFFSVEPVAIDSPLSVL